VEDKIKTGSKKDSAKGTPAAQIDIHRFSKEKQKKSDPVIL
jgi:hypothetical protein